MPEVVVVPVKSFRLGKQRLAETLTPSQRHALAIGLAAHVADVVASAGLIPLVVTADPEVTGWALSSGFPSLADPGAGLDQAAATGVAWSNETASPWIVIHADLPLLSALDVEALAIALRERGSVIAPSSDGGTSAIGSTGPFEFSFGASSFHRHLGRLVSPHVVTRRGLLLDVDLPNDLDAACSVSSAEWLRAAT